MSRRKRLRNDKKASTSSALPILAQRAAVLDALRRHETLLVVGETGSGKSTQLPRLLRFDAGVWPSDGSWQLVVTQPRRVAAASVAKRVAEELRVPLGKKVGYRVRFVDQTSRATQLLYATDGVLLREASGDPLLSKYAAIVLDEAHERSLQTDILLGLVKSAQQRRRESGSELPPLRVVIMSATLRADVFQDYFPGAGLLEIPGRTFRVEVKYLATSTEDYVFAAATACMQVHSDLGEQRGDILVFLPGQDDIEACTAALREACAREREKQARTGDGDKSDETALVNPHQQLLVVPGHAKRLLVCHLYAALGPESQAAAFAPSPPNARKIVIATNIAETSVTIPGIKAVVDSGMGKVRRYHAATGVDSLTVEAISQAAAEQRKGRAGRTQDGMCLRLYTEDSFRKLRKVDTPEIQRCNLSAVVLLLLSMGVREPQNFDFISKPTQRALLRALNEIHALGAVDDDMKLTPKGVMMAKLPVDPKFANLIISSVKHECAAEVFTLVAMASAMDSGSVYMHPPSKQKRREAESAHAQFHRFEGDVCTYVHIYNSFVAAGIGDAARNIVTDDSGQILVKSVYMDDEIGEDDVDVSRTSQSGAEARRLRRRWCKDSYLNYRVLEKAQDIRGQLIQICSRQAAARSEEDSFKIDPSVSCGDEVDALLRCLAEGLFTNVAICVSSAGGARAAYRCYKVGSQLSLHVDAAEEASEEHLEERSQQDAFLHPSSLVRRRKTAPNAVVFLEMLVTSKKYLRAVTPIEKAWLPELLPRYFRVSEAKTRSSNAKEQTGDMSSEVIQAPAKEKKQKKRKAANKNHVKRPRVQVNVRGASNAFMDRLKKRKVR